MGVETCLGAPTGKALGCVDRISTQLCDVCERKSSTARIRSAVPSEEQEMYIQNGFEREQIYQDYTLQMSAMQSLEDEVKWLQELSLDLHGKSPEAIVQFVEKKIASLCADLGASKCSEKTSLEAGGARGRRCHHVGRFSCSCMNIDSVQINGERRCRYSFLLSLGVADVHWGGDFGNANCCLQNCTTLAFYACSSKSIRKKS